MRVVALLCGAWAGSIALYMVAASAACRPSGQEKEVVMDADGNEFVRDGCPCCEGASDGYAGSLCDGCWIAAFEGRYPHGCYRPQEREEIR